MSSLFLFMSRLDNSRDYSTKEKDHVILIKKKKK